MACGCPAIVSRAGSLPEVCGDAALYFDPLDPAELAARITQVLSSSDVRLDLRERGRRHAAQFRWERCAERTLGLLEELVPA
jgi:glycosyltransferase involved in cell wall biosynthesis